jgi:DNA-binding PadR family transcriptional regulator
MHRFHGFWPFGAASQGPSSDPRHPFHGHRCGEGHPRGPGAFFDAFRARADRLRQARDLREECRAQIDDENDDEPRFGFASRRGPGGHGPGFPGGGPFGGGPGGRGFAPFGFGGGPGGLGFRMGRKLSSSDLQLVLLALIGEQPRHGYDLIKRIEEHSNGFYAPSPGVVYPALTYLEEAGDAVAEAEGSRKLYRLTDQGRDRLAERRAEADALLAQLAELGRGMDRVREAFAGGMDPREVESLRGAWARSPEVLAATSELREALAERRGATRAEWLRIAEIIREATAAIRAEKGEK